MCSKVCKIKTFLAVVRTQKKMVVCAFRRFAHEKFLGKSQQLRHCYCCTAKSGKFSECGKIVINGPSYSSIIGWTFGYSDKASCFLKL